MNLIKEAKKTMGAEFFFIEGDGSHPDGLKTLSEADIHQRMAETYHARTQAIQELMGPNELLKGNGGIAYIGYDCEWVQKGTRLNTLSYQFYLVGEMGDLTAVFFPKSGRMEDRLALSEMLPALITKAMETGCLLDYPSEVVLIGFFLRADLAMLRDLVEFKTQLGNVGGKIATTRHPVEFEVLYRETDLLANQERLVVADGDSPAYSIPVSFLDIAKHAPEGAKLEALGALLGLPKIDLPPGYSIARMDEFLAGNRQAFMDYGLRDAEIAVMYYIKALEFARNNIWKNAAAGGTSDEDERGGNQRKKLPVSAGALGVQLLLRLIEEHGLDRNEIFGLVDSTRTEWNSTTQRIVKAKITELNPDLDFHAKFVTDRFFGGRNETFYTGPTDIGCIHDYDLVGAYTTGMVSIRAIDYAASFESRDINDFLGDVMGFVTAEFEYPKSVRYPGLPVHSGLRGLRYPRRGVTFATAPELELAVYQGAQIKIRRGVVYPEKDAGGVRVFMEFVREIRRMRAAYSKDSLPEQTAKLIGNSVYGKTGQGLKGKNAFDTRTMGSQKIAPSSITNAPMAAHTTGLIRAVVGEILHRLPAHRKAFSVTTDGIMTDASPEELDLSGPLCQRYLKLCEMVEV